MFKWASVFLLEILLIHATFWNLSNAIAFIAVVRVPESLRACAHEWGVSDGVSPHHISSCIRILCDPLAHVRTCRKARAFGTCMRDSTCRKPYTEGLVRSKCFHNSPTYATLELPAFFVVAVASFRLNETKCCEELRPWGTSRSSIAVCGQQKSITSVKSRYTRWEVLKNERL